MAFLLCVDFCDYGVMRKLGSSVVSPLSGRYVLQIARSEDLAADLVGVCVEVRSYAAYIRGFPPPNIQRYALEYFAKMRLGRLPLPR